MSSSATIPGDADPERFYDTAPLEPHVLYQGEILVGVPILNSPKPNAWQLLRTRSGRRVHDALKHGGLGGLVQVVDSNLSTEQWYADGLGDYAMAVLDKKPVIVLNQTCDIESKAFLQVAPIFPADGDAAATDRLKRGEIYSAFWISSRAPEIPQQSYADIELIQAVHKSYLRRILPDQHFRLRADRTRELQRFVTRYFGRPNSFDSRHDQVPRTGTFMCVRCFYMDAVVTRVDLAEGARFPECDICRGTQWVRKGH